MGEAGGGRGGGGGRKSRKQADGFNDSQLHGFDGPEFAVEHEVNLLFFWTLHAKKKKRKKKKGDCSL